MRHKGKVYYYCENQISTWNAGYMYYNIFISLLDFSQTLHHFLIHYFREPPWPNGSVLGLRPQRLEYRIRCLEGSVISFISPSSVAPGSPPPPPPSRAIDLRAASHVELHPQEVLLTQFILHVQKDGLKPHSFYFICTIFNVCHFRLS